MQNPSGQEGWHSAAGRLSAGKTLIAFQRDLERFLVGILDREDQRIARGAIFHGNREADPLALICGKGCPCRQKVAQNGLAERRCILLPQNAFEERITCDHQFT